MSSLDNWCSPPEVAEPLEQFFGGPVDFDPCSNERSIVKARLYNDQPIGCLIPWFGRHHGIRVRTCYENPPYSQLKAFTRKGVLELLDASAGVELERLVPVAPSTSWWRTALGKEPVLETIRRAKGAKTTQYRERWAPKPTLIFTKRLFFIGQDGIVDIRHRKRQSARFDSILMYYGPREREFLREHKAITSWSLPRRCV
jgi:hypothetical protein